MSSRDTRVFIVSVDLPYVCKQASKRAAVDPSDEEQQAHITESLPCVGGADNDEVKLPSAS